MRTNSIKLFASILSAVLLSVTLNSVVLAHPSGAPAGYTGSPGDTHHCVSCHGGSAVTVTGWITSDIPASGYLAGAVYNLTVTVSGSGKKGFEVSPQDASGTQLGVLAAGTNNHLVGGTKYVTQNSSGSTSSTVSWAFTWTAPVAGTGTVTFYGAFTVGKSNTKLSTLVAEENAAAVLTANASATPSLVCAGQTSQLNVVPSGGSGTYTYAWSSIPAGFTSTIPNPVVSPAVSTQYIVHVSDGSLSTDAPADVTVNLPASADAGNDTTCAFITSQVPLHGIAANFSSVLWTTSGTGTFSAPNTLTGDYFPGSSDKTSGVVTITLTASGQSPCIVSATDQRIIHFEGPNGLEDGQRSVNPINISPNPSKGPFSVRFGETLVNSIVLTVSDIRGAIILQQSTELPAGKIIKLDMSGHASGIYLVKIRTIDGTFARKLILE